MPKIYARFYFILLENVLLDNIYFCVANPFAY